MVNVALIGCGYWGSILMRVLSQVPSARVKWCCDSREEIKDKVKMYLREGNFCTDIGKILEDDEVQGVVIATPVESHYALAGEVLRAGKDVFVEKPLAGSVGEAEELVRLAKETGRVLMVGHTFKYSPSVRKIKQLIDDGELGEIYFLSSIRVNLGIHRKDVNVVWDLAAHDFSMFLYWLGEVPMEVGCVGKDSIIKGMPDVAFISAKFPSGVVSHIEVSWLAPSKVRNTTIVGSRRMVIYSDTDPQEPVKVFDKGVDFNSAGSFGEYLLTYRTGDIHSPKVEGKEPLRLEMEHFVECIQTRQKPLSDGEDGLNVVRALAMADLSLKRRGVPVGVDDLEGIE